MQPDNEELMRQTPCDADIIAPLALCATAHETIVSIERAIIRLDPAFARASLASLQLTLSLLSERIEELADAT